MSDEEQYVILGRMATERATLKKQCAILRHELETAGEQMERVSVQLRGLGSGNHGQVAASLNGLNVQKIKTDLTEFMAVSVRLSQLTIAMRDAGIE